MVVPFAIFLAFPFYFALVTMFKTNLDLGNIEHVPYVYNDAAGHFHWDFWNYATTEHVRFLFEDTNYPRWLLNTLLVGAAVVGITLVLAMPAGYALARLAGGWGPERRNRDLPHLPRPADAVVPAAVAADHAAGPEGFALGAHPRLPVVHRAIRDVVW